MIPFVDCQGLGGQLTLATLQQGDFCLVHRTSLPGGFGDEVMDENRHILARHMDGEDSWEQEVGNSFDWTPQGGVGYLAGLPPCSGFSLLNRSTKENARGANSAINECMKELVQYASCCTGTDNMPGPEIVVFESVQGAYSQGRGLMQTLRSNLERQTGQEYDLTHVKMSGASVGAAQMRHRYFFVAHRIPFGVDPPEERVVETYESAIGDLRGLNQQWDDQAYRTWSDGGRVTLGGQTPYQEAHRRRDGQVSSQVTVTTGRMANLIGDVCDRGWEPGETMVEALHRTGYRPQQLEKAYNENWVEDGFPNPYKGWGWPTRVSPNRPGYVLTGGGIHGFVHWDEDRLLTVRECARLMGLPDEWEFPTDKPTKASLWIGKACPVSSGRWLAEWVARAHKGEPGERGKTLEDGEREYLHDSTNLYKKWPNGNPPRRTRRASTTRSNAAH